MKSVDNNIFSQSLAIDSNLFVVNGVEMSDDPYLAFKVFSIEIGCKDAEAKGRVNAIKMTGDERLFIPAWDDHQSFGSPVLKATWEAAGEENQLFIDGINKANIETYEIMDTIYQSIYHPPIVAANELQFSDFTISPQANFEEEDQSDESKWILAESFRLSATLVLASGESVHLAERVDTAEANLSITSGGGINIQDAFSLSLGGGVEETATFKTLRSLLEKEDAQGVVQSNRTMDIDMLAEGLTKGIILQALSEFEMKKQDALKKLATTTITTVESLAVAVKDINDSTDMTAVAVSMITADQKVFRTSLSNAIGEKLFKKTNDARDLSSISPDDFIKAAKATVKTIKARDAKKNQTRGR